MDDAKIIAAMAFHFDHYDGDLRAALVAALREMARQHEGHDQREGPYSTLDSELLHNFATEIERKELKP